MQGIKKFINDRELYRLTDDQDAREISQTIDFFLAPEIKDIESKLCDRYPAFNQYDYEQSELFDHSQPWIGLHPETLQTPYTSFLELFEYIENEFSINSILDVGAAYGRAAFVKNSVFPEVEYIGYEILKERADMANKLFKKHQIKKSVVLNKSIFEDDFPKADLYIIYDFSNDKDIHRFLGKLYEMSCDDQDFLIAAEGESTIELIRNYFDDFYAVQCPLPNNQRWNIYASTDDFQNVS